MSWQGGLVSGFGNLLGSGINAIMQERANKKNYEMQKEFAQNSLQWKVEDAKKAGLHPLAVLGSQGYTASPSFVGADVGSGVAGMSKDFGQAVSGYLEEKLGSESEKDQLELERIRLENQKLKNDIAKDGQGLFGVAQVGLPDPSLGQSISNASPKLKPLKIASDLDLIPLDPNGNVVRITPSPDGLVGQTMSEGAVGLVAGNIEMHRIRERGEVTKLAIEEARKAGLLKPDETYRPTWSLFGFELTKTKIKRK